MGMSLIVACKVGGGMCIMLPNIRRLEALDLWSERYSRLSLVVTSKFLLYW